MKVTGIQVGEKITATKCASLVLIKNILLQILRVMIKKIL